MATYGEDLISKQIEIMDRKTKELLGIADDLRRKSLEAAYAESYPLAEDLYHRADGLMVRASGIEESRNRLVPKVIALEEDIEW